MSPLIWAIFAAVALILLARGLARRFSVVRKTYYLGINVWGRWLPVVATGLYLSVLVINLASFGELGHHGLNVGRTLSVFEMIFLLLIGPLMLTRWANLVGSVVLVYLVERLALTGTGTTVGLQGMLLLLASSTTVAVIGDKTPWLAGDPVRLTAARMREILLVCLSVGSLGIISIGMAKYLSFARWFNASFDASMPPVAMLTILAAVFIAWLAIAMGFARNFMIPTVALPTLLTVAFITGWPTGILAVPFMACLALSLSNADRRTRDIRHVTNYRTTAFVGR